MSKSQITSALWTSVSPWAEGRGCTQSLIWPFPPKLSHALLAYCVLEGSRGHAAWCLPGWAHGLCMAPAWPKGTTHGHVPLLGSQGNKTLATPGDRAPAQIKPTAAIHPQAFNPSFLFLPAALGQLGGAGQGGPPGVWGVDCSLGHPPDLPGALSLHPANMDHTKVPAPPWGTHGWSPGGSDGP